MEEKQGGDWKSTMRAASALSAGILGMFGGMAYLFGKDRDRDMCMKKDCKGYGGSNSVKSVALRLCEKHEAAIERVPEIRALVKRIYVGQMVAHAHVMAGRDVAASETAQSIMNVEDQLFAVALAWAETPDVEVKPAEALKPAEEPTP